MFFRELLQAFADANQPYCLVGGVAVNLHGIPRMTYDVDIAVPTTRESLEGTEQILQRLGLRCRLPIRLGDLSDDALREEYRRDRNLIAVTFTDPADPLREVDVLVSPSVPATELVARATSLDLDGIPVSLVTIEDLIAIKRNTGRDQDAADIAHLERLEDVT